MIQLGHKARSKPHELSIGQRQRVALARALVRHPKVLLLDEPLSALDAELRAAMQIELRELQQRAGLTFLMVTHDQAEALVMSDEIVVMKDGIVVESGSPEDLYNQPATPYVASFLGASNLVPGRIESMGEGSVSIVFGNAKLDVLANGGVAAVGRPVTMSIRPERISLSRKEPAASSFSGRVTESFYRGEAMQILVDVGARAPLSMTAPLSWKGARGEIPRVGDEVELFVDPGSVVLFDGHVDTPRRGLIDEPPAENRSRLSRCLHASRTVVGRYRSGLSGHHGLDEFLDAGIPDLSSGFSFRQLHGTRHQQPVCRGDFPGASRLP